MKKTLFLAAACACLIACQKEGGDAAATAGSNLPQSCQDYLNKAKACFAKASGNAAAAAFQRTLDQTKAQWETLSDKRGLDAACKAANDQFAQTAAVLKC